MRTNSSGVTEVASIRTDLEKYGQEHERIFGAEKKKFCDTCEKRISLCECQNDGTKEGLESSDEGNKKGEV